MAYDPTKVDGDMGNTETGYFTVKPTAIESLKADALAPRAQQGIYTLQGVRLHTDFNHLPAGVYIVNGQKTIKH